ncbi:iron export ABC transporter permease subunit FetB [Salipaludibacillus agaradhaerens]|uniref:Iron export ABC transporter permease subunit FetB n=1 Tax=Salipaludibacillus agaradhaerens TaxID=76935 RepID=A0A9Q4G063_SALAG|nr:iron export ABC transporter permease subunit FetB [Salipaludibacillus agaradhaerens]MCR6097757.1 iron export ABC transporter permease subunit FetB [Salipaludibacillus agaradhaerens]MCR6109460.1 iron export ABC transporter permease subunit FetB [Bacillus sp. A301a_S52]MCR6112759.1 iron export ABC transporter permease subunit FetB [Salipaludibacillus agaradhaerens]
MEEIMELGFFQMAAAYIFIVVLLFILKARGIRREKELLISTLRMTLQLILVGYLLAYLFENNHVLWIILIIIIMQFFAIQNIMKRVKYPLNTRLKQIIIFSMVLGTLSSIFYFILVVVQVTPWFDARYFIPIAGMLIGNSMTGVSLGVQRLVEGMHDQKSHIEMALMLGATPKMASKKVVDQAFDAAILPTINSMVGMGIVFLPGMMTGQILAGLSPLSAIQYQIAIMLGIVGCVSLTVILFVQMGYKTFFSDQAQLHLKLN